MVTLFKLLLVEQLFEFTVEHISAASGSGIARLRVEVAAHTEILRSFSDVAQAGFRDSIKHLIECNQIRCLAVEAVRAPTGTKDECDHADAQAQNETGDLQRQTLQSDT